MDSKPHIIPFSKSTYMTLPFPQAQQESWVRKDQGVKIKMLAFLGHTVDVQGKANRAKKFMTVAETRQAGHKYIILRRCGNLGILALFDRSYRWTHL